jgi:hypothetical protein
LRCQPGPAGSVCRSAVDCRGVSCQNFRCYSACPVPEADFCRTGQGRCGFDNAGWCLQAVGGGASRCGVEPGNECVICTTSQDCEDIYGDGSFCALRSGTNCGCPATQQNFCAIPV